ncbi:MAG: 50S ribosomal protein L18 [Promethearchaeota archaeon]
MARGPKYRLPFRRRREGKTNFHRRLRLIKSRKTRLIIRASTKNLIVQFADAKIEGDRMLATAHSKDLRNKYGYKGNTGNVPAAYLTGLIAGLKAKKAGIEEAILDVGVFVKRNRVLAAFKGVLEAGVDVPHDPSFIPESLDERVTGSHVQAYAKYFDEMVKKEAEERKKAAAAKKKAQQEVKDGKITQEEFDEMDFSGPKRDSKVLYDRQFSGYLKEQGLDPHQFASHVEEVKKKIKQSVK